MSLHPLPQSRDVDPKQRNVWSTYPLRYFSGGWLFCINQIQMNESTPFELFPNLRQGKMVVKLFNLLPGASENWDDVPCRGVGGSR